MADRDPLLAALAANGAAGTLFAWSVLLPSLGADLGRDPDELGVVFSTALVAFAAAMLAGGRLVDRSGPRSSTGLAGVLSALGLATGAAGSGVGALVVGVGVLFGLASGLTYLSVVSWASTAHDPRRHTEVALVVAAFAAGPIGAAPVATVVAERLGWRVALALAAVVVPAVIVLAGRRLPPGARVASRRVPAADPPVGTTPVGDRVALVSLWAMFLGGVLPGLLAFAYAAPAATERGVSGTAAGLVVAVMAAGNLAGRLLPTVLLRTYGLLPVLWAGTAVLVLAVLALGWASSPAMALLALPLLALQYGLASALLPSATRLVAAPTRFATAYGGVFSAFGVAGIAGPYLGATLHGPGDGYAPAFRATLVAAGLAAAGLVVYQGRLRARADLPSDGSAQH